MKAVLLSIKPKYCELIAGGKKTVEIRKTRPKIDPPFKVYMYCTKSVPNIYGNSKHFVTDYNKYLKSGGIEAFEKISRLNLWNGKVIGEYICDSIIQIQYNKNRYSLDDAIINGVIAKSCVPENELYHYLQGKTPYLRHISDLKIYGEPKDLSEFTPYCEYNIDGECFAKSENVGCDCTEPDLNPDGTVNIYLCTRRLKRPPQSWCYVEELG